MHAQNFIGNRLQVASPGEHIYLTRKGRPDCQARKQKGGNTKEEKKINQLTMNEIKSKQINPIKHWKYELFYYIKHIPSKTCDVLNKNLLLAKP